MSERKEKRERLLATAVESGLLEQEEAERFADSLESLVVNMQVASDQAQAMSDAELGELLLKGRWTTIEIHEAGRRLKARAQNTGSGPDA